MEKKKKESPKKEIPQKEIKVKALNLRCRFRKEGDRWFANCPALEMTTEGASQPEAMEKLRTAILQWFEENVHPARLDEKLLDRSLFDPEAAN